MEDVDGILSISEIFWPTIEQKIKEVGEYDRHRMRDSQHKGTIWLCLAVSVVFKISKETKTKGLMMELSKLYEKP